MEHNKMVGIQLRNTNNSVKRVIDSRPITKLINKMTGTNTWLLAYIAEQTSKGKDVFQKDIEETFGVTRSCVSKVISLMEKKGVIIRKEVEYDARLRKLVLTSEAEKCAEQMRQDAVIMEQRITKGFTDEEKEQLLIFLERIQKNLEENEITT